jgi:glycosyltransferase involved in cell wall biosynthesis
MKVLMITAFPPTKAPEADHSFYLSEHLADFGLDVHVVTAKGSITASHPRITVYPIIRDWSWSDLPRLAMLMRRCSPDVVLLIYVQWIYNDHPMITFVPTISKILLPRVPFVTQFENPSGALFFSTSLLVRAVRKGMALLVGGKRVYKDGFFGTLLRDSDRIIVLSDYHRVKLSEYHPAANSKSVLIPPAPIMRMYPENNGTARQRGREILGVKTEDFLIAYFGYIYPGKGVETLLRAFHLVSRRSVNVWLIMVGGIVEFPDRPSYAQEMHELPKRLGIDDRVIWTGEYEYESDEASLYLRAADACVLPFDSGVYLNNASFAAAAAHGLPIITTRGKVLEEPFVDQQNVLLCPPKDPEALAAAIERLMDTPDLREHLQQSVLNLSQEWFSWDRVIERTIATFIGARTTS